MASRASLRAYCAFGFIINFADVVRLKQDKDSPLLNDAIYLKRFSNNAARLWEDAITDKQLRRLRREMKQAFAGANEADLLEVGCMLLAVLEDMKGYLKSEKRLAVDRLIKQLFLVLKTYYDRGDEFEIYDSSLHALERFNAILARI